MIPAETARRLVGSAARRGDAVLDARASGDAVLVTTTEAAYRVSTVGYPSLVRAGWTVYDLALDVMAEPSVPAVGVAADEHGAELRLDTADGFAAFARTVSGFVDAADLARVCSRYLLAAPSLHVVDDVATFHREVAMARKGDADLVGLPTLDVGSQASLTLTFVGWRFNREAGVDVEAWTVAVNDATTRSDRAMLATDLDWIGNG